MLPWPSLTLYRPCKCLESRFFDVLLGKQGEIALRWSFHPLRLVSTSLTVTSKGQVTLRKELLAHLGIQPGQRLEVEVLPDGRLELHAAQVTGQIDAVFGLLAGRTDRRASLEEIAEGAASGWAGQ